MAGIETCAECDAAGIVLNHPFYCVHSIGVEPGHFFLALSGAGFNAPNGIKQLPVKIWQELTYAEASRFDVLEKCSLEIALCRERLSPGTGLAFSAGSVAGFVHFPQLPLLVVLLRLRALPVGHQAACEYCACGCVRSVEHVVVERCEFDCGVQGRGGGSAYEQGRVHPACAHLPAQFLHLIKGRSDQSADSYDVGSCKFSLLEYGLLGNHHAQVGDLETVASHHYSGDVLAYVVDISLDRGHQNSGLCIGVLGAVLLHIWAQHCHRIPHYLG